LGNTTLFKREPVFLAAPRRATQSGGLTTAIHQPLFERLRALRKRLADERRVPPYIVFLDRTLQQMAAELPATQAQLLRMTGVGERKALDLGDDFLKVIADYVQEAGAQPMSWAPPSPTPRTPRTSLSPTAQRTFDLFTEGLSTAEIAATRSLALSTVEEHLTQAIEVGEAVDIERLVIPQKRRAIEAAIAALGPSPLLKPIMERLGEGYTYGEIRFVRAAGERKQ